MKATASGTIAHLVYADGHPPDFARLVGKLHAIMSLLDGAAVVFAWDGDDIATFDLPASRIALGWDERPGKGYSACVFVSVSGQADTVPSAWGDRHDDLCSQVVDWLNERHPALSILWHRTEEPLTGELMACLIARLPPLPGFGVAGSTLAVPEPQPGQAGAPWPAGVANDRPLRPDTRDPDLTRLREALYPAHPAEIAARLNVRLRLAAHALNATLILVWAPLGVAVMTYSLIRGEDMQLSARMMVVTGLFATAINTPIGHHMAALAGV